MSGCGPGGRTSGPEKYPPATRHAHRLVSPPPTAQGCLAKGSARRRVVETYEISATSKLARRARQFLFRFFKASALWSAVGEPVLLRRALAAETRASSGYG